MPGNGHGSNGGMARRSRERKEREETAAIGYVAAKKQEEMEAAAVGLRTNAHCKCDNNRQLIDLKKALDNNLLTQEEHDLQRSRVLGTEIVEPVVVTVAIAPRVTGASVGGSDPWSLCGIYSKLMIIGGILCCGILGILIFELILSKP